MARSSRYEGHKQKKKGVTRASVGSRSPTGRRSGAATSKAVRWLH